MAQDRLVLVVNKAGAVVADVLGRRPRYQWPRFPRGPKHQAQNGTVQVGLHQSLSDESDPMIDGSDLVFPLAFFSPLVPHLWLGMVKYSNTGSNQNANGANATTSRTFT